MTRAAPARAPILRPGVKGAGWATGRGRGAERIWGGASNNSRGTSRSNTCSTGSGQTRGNHWVWVWSDLVNNFLPYTSSYLWLLRCGGVWCPVVLISHLTTPNYLLHLTNPSLYTPEQCRVVQGTPTQITPLSTQLQPATTWKISTWHEDMKIFNISGILKSLKSIKLKKKNVLVLIVVHSHSHISFVIFQFIIFSLRHENRPGHWIAALKYLH